MNLIKFYIKKLNFIKFDTRVYEHEVFSQLPEWPPRKHPRAALFS
jgi:hypothetical protein